MLDLANIIADFAAGLKRADEKRPQAVNVRTKKPFQPGIGPHTEAKTVELVLGELAELRREAYAGFATGVPYSEFPRQRCDLCLGKPPDWDWAIEVKMLRFLGDNGKRNDNILMHVLSPYPQHRSALTDCGKLRRTSLGRRKALLIYGFDHDKWPLDPAIEAFENLAGRNVQLGPRESAMFLDLVHPVHTNGRVFGWEIGNGERMSYRIPIGTQIFPYSSESGEVGIGRLTTVEVELDDTAQRLTLPAHVTGERAEFLCLPLGENPTAYDRYLVRARDVEPT